MMALGVRQDGVSPTPNSSSGGLLLLNVSSDCPDARFRVSEFGEHVLIYVDDERYV